MKSHMQLLLALLVGMIAGIGLHTLGPFSFVDNINSYFLFPIGQIFLRLIFMIVMPMVFSALIMGVYELGKGRSLGKAAGKTLLFTAVASTASVLIGIALVNYFRPGDGFKIDPTEQNMISSNSATIENLRQDVSKWDSGVATLIQLIPQNPLEAAVEAMKGQMLPFMFFALIFGIALSWMAHSPHSSRNPEEPPLLILTMEEIFQACMLIVNYTMKLAPWAVFAIVFNTAYRFGPQIFVSLMSYVGIVVLGLLIQQFFVYTTLLKLFTERSPSSFFRHCKEVYLYAFATASSNATLPKSLETAEKKLKISPRISRFVLTIGSVANQNGTALFEGVTVLFLAQVYGVSLDFGQQMQVVFMSILAGIGTAGIPGGSLPLIMILLQQLGIPAEGIGLILGVDRFLDMCRTTLNISGDLVIAALVDEKK